MPSNALKLKYVGLAFTIIVVFYIHLFHFGDIVTYVCSDITEEYEMNNCTLQTGDLRK